MSPRRGDDRFRFFCRFRNRLDNGTPRSSGEGQVVGPFALFDIVGLDEGTCGRRPRV